MKNNNLFWKKKKIILVFKMRKDYPVQTRRLDLVISIIEDLSDNRFCCSNKSQNWIEQRCKAGHI